MKTPFDCPLEPLNYIQTFQLYINYALGMPFALVIGELTEFREYVLDWVYANRVQTTLNKINNYKYMVEEMKRIDRGGINH